MAVDKTYIYAVIVVIVILVLYFYYKKQKGAPKNAPKGKKRKSKRGKNAVKKAARPETKKQEKDDDEEDEVDEKAQELFELIHDDMSKGMTLDDFKEKVDEDLADDTAYMEIKQLYNTTDPQKITVADYEKILNEDQNSD